MLDQILQDSSDGNADQRQPTMASSSLDDIHFVPKQRNYARERELHATESNIALIHPLTKQQNSHLHPSVAVAEADQNDKQNSDVLLHEPQQIPNGINDVQYDPLTSNAANENVTANGLSNGSTTASNFSTITAGNSATMFQTGNRLQRALNDSWASKRVSIVIKHTPPQRLPLVTDFLSNRDEATATTSTTSLFSPSNSSAATRAALQNLRHAAGSVGRIQNRLSILQELEMDAEQQNASSSLDLSSKSISAISSTLLGSSSSSLSSLSALSEEQIFIRVHQAKRQLKIAWEKDQRVVALRHLIQCVKILSDCSNPLFYPTKWILVADVLDLFTTLLYNRLLDKSELPKTYSSRNNNNVRRTVVQISARDVPEKAKEICRNWLYKITCIRELLPRILIEIAMLPCMRFVEEETDENDEDEGRNCDKNSTPSSNNNFYRETFIRLQKMIRGLSDPLVAIWCRCYLAKVACCATTPFNANNMPQLQIAVEDFIRTQSTEIHTAFEKCRQINTNLRKSEYIETFSSALEWILECMARLSGQKSHALDHLLTICGNNRLLLRAILAAFSTSESSQVLVKFVLTILDKIRLMPADSDDNQSISMNGVGANIMANGVGEVEKVEKSDENSFCSRAQLIRSLGAALSAMAANNSSSSSNSVIELDALPKRKVLNLAWQVISPLQDLPEYTKCVESWCGFATRLLGRKEVDIILTDLLQHCCTIEPKNSISISNGHTNRGRPKTLISNEKVLLYADSVQENLLHIFQQILARPAGLPSKSAQSSSYLLQLCDLLNNSNVLKLFDILHNAGSNSRNQAARAVAESFYRGVVFAQQNVETQFSTHDPVLIGTLQTCMRTLANNDTLDDNVTSSSLAGDDERRNTSRILIAFICSVDYGRDLEAQLQFYVQCRENFYRFDDVLQLLVELALHAAMRARALRMNKANEKSTTADSTPNLVALKASMHSSRTAAFVHSCCAYAFITIPSLVNAATMQYKLYLHLTQVCLANQCLGQAEASLRAALQLLYSESAAIVSENAARESNSSATTGQQQNALLLRSTTAEPLIDIETAYQKPRLPPNASGISQEQTTTKSYRIEQLGTLLGGGGGDDRAVAKLISGAFSVLLIMPDRFVLPKTNNDIKTKKNGLTTPNTDTLHIDTLFWYHALMNACDVFCDSVKFLVKVDAVSYLCAAAQLQSRYCLHVAGIDSNDTLLSMQAAAQYMQAVQEALDASLRSILTYVSDCVLLPSTSENNNSAAEEQLANSGLAVLEALMNAALAHGDLAQMQSLLDFVKVNVLQAVEEDSAGTTMESGVVKLLLRQRVFRLFKDLQDAQSSR